MNKMYNKLYFHQKNFLNFSIFISFWLIFLVSNVFDLPNLNIDKFIFFEYSIANQIVLCEIKYFLK